MNRSPALLVLMYLITMFSVAVTLTKLSGTERTVDQGTKTLCRWYADKDHEKEINPDRWQWFLDRHVDVNKDFDWYEYCISHHQKPVAQSMKKEPKIPVYNKNGELVCPVNECVLLSIKTMQKFVCDQCDYEITQLEIMRFKAYDGMDHTL